MTNAESYLQNAVEKLDNNELNSYEAGFIEKIRNYNKKQLRTLTSKQFHLLRNISRK